MIVNPDRIHKQRSFPAAQGDTELLSCILFFQKMLELAYEIQLSPTDALRGSATVHRSEWDHCGPHPILFPF